MRFNEHSFCVRAAKALQALVDGDGQLGDHGHYVPAAVDMPHARLIIAGGDTDACLDPAALRPLAIRTGCDVLGLWVDPIRSGHRYLIDVVLAGEPVTVLTHYRLWLTKAGAVFLVPDFGDGPAIEITAGGLRRRDAEPFADLVARTTGIALGQAYLQAAVFAGTPFATPIDRNIAR